MVFATVSSIAQSGEIYGTITSEGGDSLGATYVSLFKGGNQVSATYSDFNGAYSLTGLAPGKYDVSVEAISYQIKRINEVIVGTNQKVEVPFKLITEATSLGAVEIITYRKPLIDKDRQAKIYTGEEIEQLAVRDISAIVATSVDVVSQDDGSGDINVRGQRSEGTQMIVDGIKINGKLSIPQNAIEQVEVISGGVPAMYGDNIGGVIIVTTKGSSAKAFGGFETVTSTGLDGYDYNLITANFSGPILKRKKDSLGNVIKKSPLGFLISGEYRFVKDPRPSILGAWSLPENILNDLEQNPLRAGANGSGTVRNSEYVTSADLQKNKARENVEGQNVNVTGKIDFQPTKNSTLTAGGNYNYSKSHTYIYSYSLFNSVNNPEYINHDYTAFLRWKQRLNTDSVSWVKGAYYQLQADYSSSIGVSWDDSHKDDFFKYGYVGQFKTHKKSLYDYENGGVNGDAYYFQGDQDVLYEFLGGGDNPNAANYASQFYSLYNNYPEGNYENWSQAQSGGALLNGDRPEHVYGLWYNTGRQYNGYSKEENNQLRFNGVFAANFFKNHQVNIGFEHEERIKRAYFMNPIGLWEQMRQLANAKNTELDLNNPELTFSNGVFTDTVNYNYLYQGLEGGKGFYENIRDQNGMAYDDFYDSDFYGPENYNLSLFSADEMLGVDGLGSAYGYDYTGRKIKTGSFADYLQKKDGKGSFLRHAAPFNPIYSSGYIQDKFQFNDIVLNIGLRIDRYDANQMVLKDPYLLYDSYKAKDLSADYDVPNTINDEAVVYINDAEVPNPSVLGYRLNSNWFDADGKSIADPSLIAEKSATGEVTPFLKDPNTKIGDANFDPKSSFKDYEAQITIMPRISLTFNLTETSSFFAHYDILSQRPSASQSYFIPFQYLNLENSVGGFLTNPDLKPQRTIDYEVGYQKALNEKSAITLSAYYREMKDLIQITGMTYASPSNYLTYGNLDKGLVKGLSVKYDLRPIHSNVSLNVGYSLQFADGTGSSPVSSAALVQQGFPDLKVMLPLDFDQRHTIKSIFNYTFKPGKKYKGPDWNGKGRAILGGLSANFVSKLSSGRPYTGQSNFTPEGSLVNAERKALDGLINGNRLPWIYTTDMRISRKFIFGLKKESDFQLKSELYLVVTNLFDTKNIVKVYSSTGNPEDDGYLNAASSQSQISTQTNYESYTDLYALKIANPANYALPRQIRLGFVMTF